MRIVIYSHSFAPAIGGVETYVKLLASGLAASRDARGNRNTVLVITQTPQRNDEAYNFDVVRTPSLSKLWRLIGSANVLHVAGPCIAPIAIALLRRRHVVVEHHGYQVCCPNGLLFKSDKSPCDGHFLRKEFGKCLSCEAAERGQAFALRSLALTFIRRMMSAMVSSNIMITRHLKERAALKNSQVTYYGIPFFETAIHHPTSQPVTFGYVGRLVSEKGLLVLLDALMELERTGKICRLIFVGDGPERQRLESRLAQLSPKAEVKFAGLVSGSALAKEVEAIDVVVMPSIWEETAGLSAIEQMMRSKCVIGADIGGLGEILGDCALKFRAGDATDLAKRMVAVIDNPELLTTLGAKAHARAADLFQIDRMIAEHLTAFQRSANS